MRAKKDRRIQTAEKLPSIFDVQQHPARREAQLNFVMWLQVAYVEATGEPPSPTAHPRRPTPFAKMAQVCLDKLQAEANAVEMINGLQRRRKDK